MKWLIPVGRRLAAALAPLLAELLLAELQRAVRREPELPLDAPAVPQHAPRR